MQIAIFTYESPQANFITRRLLAEFPGRVCGILRSSAIVARKTTWQSLAFLVRHTGLGFTLPKGGEVLGARAADLVFRLTRGAAGLPSLATIARQASVPLHAVHDVASGDARQIVAAWHPDLIVSVYFNQRIPRAMVERPRLGCINVHGSLLPRDRGLFPYFWALANGQTETGVTVHWVNGRFDDGDIILQERLPIVDGDTVSTLACRGAAVGAGLVTQAARLIAAGQAPRRSQERERATYHSWPRRADVRRLRGRGRRYGSIFGAWPRLRVPALVLVPWLVDLVGPDVVGILAC